MRGHNYNEPLASPALLVPSALPLMVVKQGVTLGCGEFQFTLKNLHIPATNF